MLKSSPLFTFKHYAAIIKVLRVTRPFCHDFYPEGSDARAVVIHCEVEWDNVVYEIADMFAADNPKFKRDLFIAMCHQKENQEDKAK